MVIKLDITQMMSKGARYTEQGILSKVYWVREQGILSKEYW